MTTLRDGPLSRPRGGSIQWQTKDAGSALLRAEFFGPAAPAGITGTLSGTLAAATLSSAATLADLDVPSIGATVAKGYDNSTTATTAAVTTQATTALLVFAQWETTSTPPVITDSKGNTYGSPIRTIAPGAGSIPNFLGAWFLAGATGGSSHTFTATGGANTFPSIWVVEVPLAAAAAHVGAGSTASPYNSGNLVTTADSRLVGFAGAENTTTVTHTVNSAGFAKLSEITDGSAAWTGVTAHRQAGAGTYSFDVSVSSSQDGGSILVAVQKAAGGGINGTTSATLGAATAVATGAVRIAGALTATLAQATLASTSTVRLAGTLASTLGTTTATGAGGLTVAGTLAQTLGAATLAATGTTRLAAAVSQALADATLVSAGTIAAAGSITGSLTATLGDATLVAEGTIPGAEPSGPTPAGRGSSNLRDVWTVKDAPFEVRTAKRKRRYKTAQAATTAIREAAKAGQPVELVVRGEPINLPRVDTASYADIFARIERAERVRAAQRAEAESRRRLLQEREDEEALVMALARLWRL